MATDASSTANMKRLIAPSSCSRIAPRAGAGYVNPALWLLAALMQLTAAAAAAQDPDRVYRPNPADEDWSFRRTPPEPTSGIRRKHIRLGRDGWFMTASGEIRVRPEGFRIRPTDDRPSVVDNYLLQRYLFGADTHFGARTRVFAELQSGIIEGALARPPGNARCSSPAKRSHCVPIGC
jgi:hypothetical protein